jgi:peptidoglycan/LPS O-acetylase OafA/YrhL
MINYRPEIDGLRALAVVPVILFHAGFEAFSGGFVGVDVFFVISGYLITSIILTQKAAGTFSLVNFYERRARRILPTLFFVIATCIPFAWLWLLPKDMKDFAESVGAVSLFLSNHLFLSESGYFETAAELKPLLHMWSLAVEEQYYILFPLFLLVMWRFAKRWTVSALALITISSFALAQWAAYNKPAAAFFLLPARGWEIAIGALVAFYFARFPKLQLKRSVQEIGSFMGLLLILYAVFAYSKATPFPSVYTLAPTLGAALIILCTTPSTFVGCVLKTKVFVGAGLISYSAYLWHQPLFAFARYRFIDQFTQYTFVYLIILVFTLAAVTYFCIELPIRKHKFLINRKSFFYFFIGLTVTSIAFALVGNHNNGYAKRYAGTAIELVLEATKKYHNQCQRILGKSPNVDHACTIGNPNNQSFSLLGDSHAGALIDVFDKYAKSENIGGRGFTVSGCLPLKLSNRTDHDLEEKNACRIFKESFFSNLSSNTISSTLIVSGRWTFGIERSRFDNKEGGIEPGRDIYWDNEWVKEYGYENAFELDLRESIVKLIKSGKTVILIYPVPEMGWDVPRYLLNKLQQKSLLDARDGSISHQIFRARNEKAYKALDSIGQHPNLYRVYPEKVFCNTVVTGRCVAHINGTVLYRDDDHLSNAGAAMILDKIRPFL